MRTKTKPGRRTFFSNVDELKYVLSRSDTPMKLEALVTHFRQVLASAGLSDEIIESEYILPVLHSHPFFQETPEGWKLHYPSLEEHQYARLILREKMVYMKEGELVELLSQKLSLPKKRVFFFPQKDPAFVETELPFLPNEKMLGLREFILVHEDAYQILAREERALTEKEILTRIRNQGKYPEGKILVLMLEHDPRFQMEKKKWRLKEKIEEQATLPRAAWEVEEGIREKVQNVLEALQEWNEKESSITVAELIRRRLKKGVEAIQGTVFYRILTDYIREREEKGELVRVRGFGESSLLNVAWHSRKFLEETLPELPDRALPFAVGEYELLKDKGLDEEEVALLGEKILYYLDGDFREDEDPPSETCLVLTHTEIMTGVVWVPKAVLTQLARWWKIPESEVIGRGAIAEIQVHLPGGITAPAFLHFGYSLLMGLEDWVMQRDKGEVFSLSDAGAYQLEMKKVADFSMEEFTDEEMMTLEKLAKQAGQISLKEAVQQVLQAYPQGLATMSLYYRVNFVKRVRRRHLFSLLSRYYCFQKKNGKWRYLAERKDWGERKAALAYSEDIHFRRYVVALFSDARKNLFLEESPPYLLAPPQTYPLQPGDYLLVYSGADRGIVADGFVDRVLAEKGYTLLHATRWQFPVSWRRQVVDSREKIHFLNWEELTEILHKYDSIFYEQVWKKYMVREFAESVVTPIRFVQELKDAVQKLEKLLEEPTPGFIALKSLSMELSRDFTYENFQALLGEKYYSRPEIVDLTSREAEQIYKTCPVSPSEKILWFPSGDGKWPIFYLEEIKKALKNAGYEVVEEGIQIFPSEQPVTLAWERVIPDARKREKVRGREESITVEEVLSVLLPNNITLVEERELQYYIGLLNFRLKRYDTLNPLLVRLADFQRQALKMGLFYDKIFCDCRGVPAKNIRNYLHLAFSLCSPAGTVWILSQERLKWEEIIQEFTLSEKLFFYQAERHRSRAEM
ncbi:MAG: hypothetical protein V2G33_05335 [bacterium JZ-2024 1]